MIAARRSPWMLYGFPLLALSAAVFWKWPGLPRRLLTAGDYMPHGHCYLWNPGLVSLHVVSDMLIGLSYVGISAMLTYLVYRAREDIPFSWMFLAFGMFIISCGATHFMEVWTLWHAHYWLAGAVKLATAAASVGTAVVLPALIPKAITLGEEARLSRRRKDELESLNEELRSFSYSVSHDLRAPLRSIDGFSQALLEDCSHLLDAQAQDYLGRIRAASQRMALLIDDMLSLARVSRLELRLESVDLSGLAGGVAAALAGADERRRVSLKIAPGVSALGDPELLGVALANLIENSWKFTSKTADPAIEFGFLDHAGSALYYVRDNGAGFDMAYAGKLFQPFQRLHRADEFPGTGIGLATVQRIIERHGGRIWAEGRPDAGATFYFTLGAERENNRRRGFDRRGANAPPG